VVVNRRTVRIEWGDCDPAGIVFFPRYFAFFDACTHAMFERVGFSKGELIRTYDIVGWPVVDVRAHFHAPSTVGDDVDIETEIYEWGTSSFKVRHQLFKESALAVESFETRVWVERRPGTTSGLRPKPIPPELIERFR
jgi:4-hydroxybenzoyl-CoA thioesterase